MNLTPRERVRRALSYQPVDRLPTQVNYTAAMGEKLAAHFGVALADLDGKSWPTDPVELVRGTIVRIKADGEGLPPWVPRKTPRGN